MNSYRIFETDEFLKNLEDLDSRQHRYIKKRIHNYIYPQLKQNPYFGKNIKKLQGYEPITYRYRSGKFRLFYIVDQDSGIIFMLSIDYRKNAYR